MTVNEVLKEFRLKSTSCRVEVLTAFMKNEQALGQADIERGTSPTHDRVTIYRTIKTFLSKGLIHKVLDDAGGTKYALCQECSSHRHNHEHVHFKCDDCGQTLCIDDVSIPKVQLPEGYKINEKSLLIQGICTKCNS